MGRIDGRKYINLTLYPESIKIRLVEVSNSFFGFLFGPIPNETKLPALSITADKPQKIYTHTQLLIIVTIHI